MSELSDRKLLRVLAERQDYVPEAIRAAELEIASREIPSDIIEQATLVGKEAEAIALERQDMPLSELWKWLYFIFSPLTLTPFVAFMYRYHGDKDYDRRSVESLQMTFLGLLFYAALYGVLMRIFGPAQEWF